MTLDIAALARVPFAAEYDLSPDGRLAVIWNKSGQWRLHLLPLKGRANLPAKDNLLGTPAGVQAGPRFSPDGRLLAFAQDYGGDECFDLFVYDLATGQTRNLTPDTPREAINPVFSWSPDGREIAFVSDRGGRFAAYALEVAAPAGAPRMRRLTDHAYTDLAAHWSPDGRHIAVTALVHGQETQVFIVPAAGGEARPIAGASGPLDASQPRWSPDGRQLAFISNSSGFASVCTYNLAAGVVIHETEPTHEAGEPAWSPDGRQLAYTWNEDGQVGLRIKDLTAGASTPAKNASAAVHPLGLGPGLHSHPEFLPDGSGLICLHESARRPGDVWVLPFAGRARALTRSLPARYTDHAFVAPRVARWESDGLTITGLLYLPRNFKRGRPRPAVLYVHGGPTWQFTNFWAPPVQHLVSAGFVVLAPNYRGSTGYGRAFQEANRFDLGGGDMRDVIAGAEFLVREGYAAADRLAITGASYGGYLTMTALTRHPGVFAAGSAVVPFLNWFTEHASERADLQYWDEQNFGHPVRDAERYREYSPFFHLQHIVAPVQMFAGANDPRCPAAETEQAAATLRQIGRPHEVVVYPDEGHAFRHMANRVDFMRRRAEFLLQHLAPKKAAPRRPAKPARRTAAAKPARRGKA